MRDERRKQRVVSLNVEKKIQLNCVSLVSPKQSGDRLITSSPYVGITVLRLGFFSLRVRGTIL